MPDRARYARAVRSMRWLCSVLVLMLGGASHAELRCALDAGGGGKVAFGCTAVLTPLQYLRALRAAGCAPGWA